MVCFLPASLHIIFLLCASAFGSKCRLFKPPSLWFFVAAVWANIPAQDLPHDGCPLHHGSMPEVTKYFSSHQWWGLPCWPAGDPAPKLQEKRLTKILKELFPEEMNLPRKSSEPKWHKEWIDSSGCYGPLVRVAHSGVSLWELLKVKSHPRGIQVTG